MTVLGGINAGQNVHFPWWPHYDVDIGMLCQDNADVGLNIGCVNGDTTVVFPFMVNK